MDIRVRIAPAVSALALAGSLVGILATAAPAGAAAGGNLNLQYCRSIAYRYSGNITGPCVSYFQSQFNSSATNVYNCKVYLVPLGVFPTVGACVSYLNQNPPPP